MQKVSSSWRGFMLFLCGMCMGAADLVPGISGGTIAFILGFYEPLLESIKTLNGSNFQCLLKGQWRAFSQQVAWPFLFTLGLGILSAFVLLASFFQWVLGHEVYRIYLYSAFMGLIVASFCFCIKQVRVWTFSAIISLVVGALIAYLLTGNNSVSSTEGPYAVQISIETTRHVIVNYDTDQQLLTGLSGKMLGAMVAGGQLDAQSPVYNEEGQILGIVQDVWIPNRFLIDPWLIVCGAIAVCALLLPGISGSYLLNLLGVYPVVISALADFIEGLKHLSWNQEAFLTLFSLFIGIVAGAILFARFLSWLLRHAYDLTIAGLSGFVIGALRSVWPFWSYEYVILPLKWQKGPQLQVVEPYLPVGNSSLVMMAFAFAIAGWLLVAGIDWIAKRRAPQLAQQ